MKKAQVNTFTKGISSDIDYMLRKTDSWDFPTMNYRLVNKDGQGYILTTLSSNTRTIDAGHTEGEEYKLDPGYIAIGAVAHRGVLYIVSHNPQHISGYPTRFNSQIGTFPSPNPITNIWERVYRPLKNYTPTTNNYFTSWKFNYSLKNMCEVLCKDSYDSSVDIYICDDTNPNRVINSGIKRDGTSNGRMYNESDFYSTLNQMPTTGSVLKTKLNNIETGGSLKFGNYYFYFRYLTADFNKTMFVAECGVCQIYKGGSSNQNTEGGYSDNESDKKVSINLSGLDTSYTYLQVAYVRYLSDDSNVVFKETGLIDKYFSITGSTIDVQISGNEAIIPFTEAELNAQYPVERTCKSHVQVDNRYFGANWKSPDRNSLLLAELVSKIKPELHMTSVKDGSANVSAGVIDPLLNAEMQYKNYYMTYDRVGYFRGEPYAVAAGFIFTDGTTSNVFPTEGKDFVAIGQPTNNKGLIRFPFHDTHPTELFEGSEAKMSILGLRFNMTDFINGLNLLSEKDREWIGTNVKGIFFARQERKKWMRFQGLSIMGNNGVKRNLEFEIDLVRQMHEGSHPYASYWNRVQKTPDDQTWYGQLRNGRYYEDSLYDEFWGLKTDVLFNSVDPTGRGKMPLYMGLMPMMSVKEKGSGDPKYWGYYAARSFPEPELYGLYCPDYLFNHGNEDVSSYTHIKVVAKTMGKIYHEYLEGYKMEAGGVRWDINLNGPDNVSSVYPRFLIYNMKMPVSYPANLWKETRNTFPVGDGSPELSTNAPFADMINMATDHATNESTQFAYVKGTNDKMYNSNRNIYTPKYIGLKFNMNTWKGSGNADGFYNSDDNLDLAILNIYGTPIGSFDLETHYDSLGSSIYFQIGQAEEIHFDYVSPIPFSMANHNIIRYYGDCFLQRTFFKQLTWTESMFGDGDGNQVGLCYSDALTECASAPVYSKIKGGSLATSEKGYYRHGVILGIVTENQINTAMRFTNVDKDYYPHYGSIGWGYLPLDARGLESWFTNRGHSSVLSVKAHSYYDEYAPYEVNIRPTRIRHSAKHTPYSFIDAYRLFDVLGYQDYEISDGPINALKTYLRNLISVQETSVNSHSFGREEVIAPTNIGDVVLGRSNYLSPYVQKLADFGTHHQFSVISTDNAIYGIDIPKRIIWVSKYIVGENGHGSLQAVSLTTSKLIEKWMFDLAKTYTDKRSDIVSLIVDQPALFNGVVSGYDPSHDEVVFTFLDSKTEHTIPSYGQINWGYNSYGVYEMLQSISMPVVQAQCYDMGRLYSIGGISYICILSFCSNGAEPNPDNIEQFVRLSDIEIVPYDSTAYYTNQFVLVCSDEVCTENFAKVLGVAREFCENACILLYISGEDIFAESICKNPLSFIVTVCPISEVIPEYRTLVFNELVDDFIGEYSFGSHMYSSIANDFYSFKPFGDRSMAYLHNRDTSDLLIYNRVSEAVLTIVVNGFSENENLSIFEKAFDNIHIMTNPIPFSSVEFQTENHRGVKDPFDSSGIEFWSDPEWLENKFYMPIQCQTEPETNEFIEESQMRGTWMKITLRYIGTVRKFIKSVITEFTQSEV